MEKLKDIRDILLVSFVAMVSMIFVDSLVYKGFYSYLYLGLSVILLLAIVILSIIIYDTSFSNSEDVIDETPKKFGIESLLNGESFKLPVCHFTHNYTKKEKTFIKYMRILDGVDK